MKTRFAGVAGLPRQEQSLGQRVGVRHSVLNDRRSRALRTRRSACPRGHDRPRDVRRATLTAIAGRLEGLLQS
jgi:hypothetical protein